MEKKIGLQSLNDPVDTTTSHGRLIFNLFASLAEFERDIMGLLTYKEKRFKATSGLFLKFYRRWPHLSQAAWQPRPKPGFVPKRL